MKAIALVVAFGFVVVGTLAGCQVSGDSDVDTTRRPSARAELEVGGTGGTSANYTMSAQAIRDTEWSAGTDATAARGTIRAGDRVMFDRAPDPSMEWQQARTVDGRIVYVRPTDFRVSARSR
jgi:hypothetical protein